MEKRIAVCLTSRGNYATLGSVLHGLNDESEIKLDVVVAGASVTEKFGRLTEMLEEDGIEVTRELHNLIEGGTLEGAAKTTGLSMLEFTNEISRLGPDAVITMGDRFETMAVTLATSYLNVPLIHTHGGEITGSIDEKVRHATTKMADYHFVCTERSEQIVRRMGERSERVFQAGDPSMDPAVDVLEENTRYDPQDEYDGVGADIDIDEPYLVVQYHPVHTECNEEYAKTSEVLSAVYETGVNTFWFWPNMDVGNTEVSRAIQDFREEKKPERFRFFTNLHPKDYLRLVNGSACYVGNSSVGIRECSFLGQPSVNIGDRQQYRERVENVVDVPIDKGSIINAISEQMDVDSYPQSTLYGDGEAGERLKEIILETELSPKGSMKPEDLGIGGER